MGSLMNSIKHIRNNTSLKKLFKKTETEGTFITTPFNLYSLMEDVGDPFHLPSDSHFKMIPSFFGTSCSDIQVVHHVRVATLPSLR